MKVASNKIDDIIKFYFSELKNNYTEEEIKILIQHSFMHFINFSPTDIITKKNESVNQSDLLKLYDCCKSLQNNIPIQYILGETTFFGLTFKVNKDVLIPRPETEELVELILQYCKEKDFTDVDILDIGTGSGCIPVSIKKNMEDANVAAIDISQNALEVAQSNAMLNNVTIMLNRVDVLSNDAEYSLDNYDIIVSNPPYIPLNESDSMHVRVKENEPAVALFVENDNPGIFYNRIIELCKAHLNPGGVLFFELNPLYADQIKKTAINSNLFFLVELIKDLSGNIRFLKAVKHE